MKKVLLATSMLVATTGFAAAEVTLSGDGRMGVYYNGDETNFTSRIRAKFTLSGESDSGLTFGGSFNAHEATTAANGSTNTVWVSGAFGKIEMGDTVGAAEAVLFDLPEVGFTDLNSNAGAYTGAANLGNDINFLTGDGADGITAASNPSLLYTYSFNDFTIAASFTDGYRALTSTKDNQAFALGVGYTFGDYSVGLAHEVLDSATSGVKNVKATWLGGKATFGDTTVSAIYGTFSDAAATGIAAGVTGVVDNQLGLGVSSKFDALTVSAYVKETSYKNVTAGGKKSITGYGIGAAYNLGGGASVVGGIADNDAPTSDAVADLGLKFSF